jgi:predicted nuclease with TOPRIM domain
MHINTDIFTDKDKQLPVEKLGFCTGTLNTLRANDIYTLGELLEYAMHRNLMGLRNLGRVKYDEIMSKLFRLQAQSFRDEIQFKDVLIQKSKDIDKKISEYNAAIRKLNQEKSIYEQQITKLNQSIKGNGK